MFFWIKVEKLQDTILELRKELAELKLQKSLSEKEVRHLIKMREEQLAVNAEKAMAALISSHNTEIMGLEKAHNKTVIDQLTSTSEDIKTMYSQILERLPNIEVAMKKGL